MPTGHSLFDKVRVKGILWDVDGYMSIRQAQDAAADVLPEVRDAKCQIVQEGNDRVLEFYHPRKGEMILESNCDCRRYDCQCGAPRTKTQVAMEVNTGMTRRDKCLFKVTAVHKEEVILDEIPAVAKTEEAAKHKAGFYRKLDDLGLDVDDVDVTVRCIMYVRDKDEE